MLVENDRLASYFMPELIVNTTADPPYLLTCARLVLTRAEDV